MEILKAYMQVADQEFKLLCGIIVRKRLAVLVALHGSKQWHDTIADRVRFLFYVAKAVRILLAT